MLSCRVIGRLQGAACEEPLQRISGNTASRNCRAAREVGAKPSIA